MVSNVFIRDSRRIYFELLLHWKRTKALALLESCSGIFWVDALPNMSGSGAGYTILDAFAHRMLTVEEPDPVRRFPDTLRYGLLGFNVIAPNGTEVNDGYLINCKSGLGFDSHGLSTRKTDTAVYGLVQYGSRRRHDEL